MKSSLIIFLVLSLSGSLKIYGSGVEWSRAYIEGLENLQGEFRSVAFTQTHGVASWSGGSSSLFKTEDGYIWKAMDPYVIEGPVSFKEKIYFLGYRLNNEFNWELIEELAFHSAPMEALVLNDRIIYVSLFAGPLAYSIDGSNWISANATTGSAEGFNLDRLSGAYVDGYYYLCGGFPDNNIYRSSDLTRVC